MSEQAVIDFAKEKDTGGRFKKLLKYRNGEPRSVGTVLLCTLLTLVVFTIAFLNGKASHETILTSTNVFSVPTLTAQPRGIELPEYHRGEVKSQAASRPAGHRKFARAEKLTGPQLLKRPQAIKIPPGTMAKSQLISGASNGLVKAELKEPVVIDGERLVDAGTIAIGQGSSTDNRLYIKFTRLVYRDGTTESVTAEAADESDKTIGLKGSQIGYRALRLGSAIALNFAGGLAAGLQETQGQFGATVTKPTLKNALLNGAATASLDESRDMMQSLRNEPPVIEIPPSRTFYLIFNANGE